jgi:hypothetical protein
MPRDHPVLASVSRSYPRLEGSLITCYSPVRHFTRPKTFTCDLHASSTPPTFVLSQDQTLHFEVVQIQCLAISGSTEEGQAAVRTQGSHPAHGTVTTLTRSTFEATLNAKDQRSDGLAAVERAEESIDWPNPVKPTGEKDPIRRTERLRSERGNA